MDKIKLKQIIREEVKKTLTEGAILNAITPRLTGDLAKAVEALDDALQAMDVTLTNEQADELANCVIDIIDEAKAEGY